MTSSAQSAQPIGTQTLVTVDELAAALASPTPPVVLDVRWYLTEPERGRAEYLRGHVPGAVFVPVEHELSAPIRAGGAGGRHPLPEPDAFQAAMRRAGVNDDSTVVVLDQGISLAAGRLWWMLRDAGFEAVSVLDGGFAAWATAGQSVEVGEQPSPAGTVTLRPGQRPQVDADALIAHQRSGGAVFDVRAAERFAGEVEPIDPVAGHIPGAINLPATGLFDQGRFLPADQLRSVLRVARPGDVVSCGSGITAAQVLLAAEIAGITGLRLYPGSWSDWISDSSRAVATGP